MPVCRILHWDRRKGPIPSETDSTFAEPNAKATLPPEDTYIGIPKPILEKMKAERVDNINRERTELAKIELAIKIQDRGPSPFSEQERLQILASGGHIRGLMDLVVKVLDATGSPLTATEIADTMYSHSWSIPVHQFRRRVVVTVSAAYNSEDPAKRVVSAHGIKPGTREMRWGLPSWITPQLFPDTEQHAP